MVCAPYRHQRWLRVNYLDGVKLMAYFDTVKIIAETSLASFKLKVSTRHLCGSDLHHPARAKTSLFA
jgi:hypothetical protein